jgi:hypothetical protein
MWIIQLDQGDYLQVTGPGWDWRRVDHPDFATEFDNLEDAKIWASQCAPFGAKIMQID